MKKTYSENNTEVIIDCKYVAMIWRNTELYSAKHQTAIKNSSITLYFPKIFRNLKFREDN